MPARLTRGRRGGARIGLAGSDPGQHLVEVLEGPDRALRPPGNRLAGLLDCSHVQSSSCLGSRPGWTGCDQRAGPRRKRLSPGRRNVCHLADTTGMNPAATGSQRQRATAFKQALSKLMHARLHDLVAERYHLSGFLQSASSRTPSMSSLVVTRSPWPNGTKGSGMRAPTGAGGSLPALTAARSA
jgi:hypothetical protein